MRSIQQYGIRVIAKITSYAEWDYKLNPRAQPGKKHGPSPYKPNDMEAYKEFVRRVVERYDGDGENDMPGLRYPVLYYEILNEPDLDNEESAQAYFEILKRSYQAVKEVNLGAKVVLGGLVTGTRHLRILLENNMAPYFDVINWH